jgi:hypothetical protein
LTPQVTQSGASDLTPAIFSSSSVEEPIWWSEVSAFAGFATGALAFFSSTTSGFASTI